MAGHSKWANIKHRKAAQDSRKGKVFTRLIRELTIAAKSSADPENNPRLRTAIQTALSQNMTRDTVDRAIKRGAGTDEANNMEEIRYEGYGPGGVAIMVDCYSDNRNRTVSEVRHALTRNGGSLGTDGSVAYLFKEQGMIYFAPETPEDVLIEAALEAGAEDILSEEEGFIVLTHPYEFSQILENLAKKNFKSLDAEVTQNPSTTTELTGDQAIKFSKMIEMLEELDDVQNVYSNGSVSE
ncbi:MAG: YebC/PmpR family DNA-binding transcriptional regulator [Gammaproteobacteria bacterium]|nr:YebC/PmpR family DNA-binding transcriptional regulator [Gammaproteobacteria bacterium]